MKKILIYIFFLHTLFSLGQTYPSQNIDLLSLIDPNTNTLTIGPDGRKYAGCWGWHQTTTNKEYAIGAASLTDYFIVPHADVTEEYIQQELQRVRSRLKEMYMKFMGDKEPENLKGKTVIVIDDGIATGNTLMGTVNVLRKSNPEKL